MIKIGAVWKYEKDGTTYYKTIKVILKDMNGQIIKNDTKCKNCGETDITKLEYGPDPYGQEMGGDETLYWMCESCLESSAQDI